MILHNKYCSISIATILEQFLYYHKNYGIDSPIVIYIL
jgi:hypothetical protein